MAMNYTSLTAAKGVSGSIATWVSYTKLDVPPIVDEAQALIYSLLRTREMLAPNFLFTMPVGQANVPLPARFLDPIGRIYMPSINTTVIHKDSNFVQRKRSYTETAGSLGTNALTTVNGSTAVTVNLANHGFSQDSPFNISGAVAFNGVTLNGIFPVASIVDANDFTIDISTLGQVPNASGAGGGAALNYVCDNLTTGIPAYWAIWNETIYFETAFAQACNCTLQYYQSLPLLSSTNLTNFLTSRYPQLMRTACVTAAADFMKDDNEYQKGMTRLTALVERINVENDGSMRGMELDPIIP